MDKAITKAMQKWYARAYYKTDNYRYVLYNILKDVALNIGAYNLFKDIDKYLKET